MIDAADREDAEKSLRLPTWRPAEAVRLLDGVFHHLVAPEVRPASVPGEGGGPARVIPVWHFPDREPEVAERHALAWAESFADFLEADAEGAARAKLQALLRLAELAAFGQYFWDAGDLARLFFLAAPEEDPAERFRAMLNDLTDALVTRPSRRFRSVSDAVALLYGPAEPAAA